MCLHHFEATGEACLSPTKWDRPQLRATAGSFTNDPYITNHRPALTPRADTEVRPYIRTAPPPENDRRPTKFDAATIMAYNTSEL